jgi:hypothetical protein
MGSSFTVLQERGFWAPDGHVEVWLEALADVVSPTAPQWLLDARRHWRTQARTGFQGCVDADLDSLLTTPDRIQTLRQVTDKAREFLVHLGGQSARLPATWLNERGVGGPTAWSDDLELSPVLLVADAFAQLLSGEVTTAATTSRALPIQVQERSPAGGIERDAASRPIPVWAIAANVVEQRPFGPWGADQRRGLKLFSGGAKVYVVDGFAGMGYDAVTVVGRPRKSSRFSIVHVRAEHLNKWRVELVYSPAAMDRIAEVRERGGGFELASFPDFGAQRFRDALTEVADKFSARTDADRAQRLAEIRQNARYAEQPPPPSEHDLPAQTGLAATVSRRCADVLRAWHRLLRS